MNTPLLSEIQKDGAAPANPSRRSPRGPGRNTTQETLQRVARETVAPAKLVIASHREPYQHVHRDGGIKVIRSAGGLASALDSVAQATGATWVALGSGDADRETADADGRVAMPPKDPRYTLQRLWIESDETLDAYRRFANGCLWPLCHVVYVRPQFDRDQWEAYREVNRRFAESILRAVGDGPAIVLLQDYQLALAAKMLREAKPDLSLVLFWHIPWPNAEVFRILPWRQEILEGLLATDLIGFHINYHGFNFMETVARELEVHVDRERSALKRRGHRTYVRAYPIAPDALEIARTADLPSARQAAADLRRDMGLGNARVVLGVDRLDYTKGIPERLDAFERILEQQLPGWDNMVMVQIGVPSRVDLPDYQALQTTVADRVAQINERFGSPGSPVIHLIIGNLGFDELIPYYVLGDVMAVTSLHDGMNLVAKEYVAARLQDDGVLVLSPYAGASRELEHAIQASPYDTDELARALSRALTLDPEAQRVRMRALRDVVSSHNIYDWGRALFRDIRRLHLTPEVRAAREALS
jgi:trehalose 6-phosphate synthase